MSLPARIAARCGSNGDSPAYQRLLDDLDLVASIKSIQRGLAEAKRGEGRPAREFLKELASEHGIKLSE